MQVKEIRDIETNELQGYKIIDEGLFVPLDLSNRYYQEIQEWINEGNAPLQSFTFEEVKNHWLNKLNTLTKAHIERFYPQVKQQSDIADKEYYGSALLMINSTYTTDTIYRDMGTYANQIWDGISTLQDILATLPTEEQPYWEQLIKVAVRVTFVIKCKQIYYTVKSVLESYTTEEEIRGVKIYVDNSDNCLTVEDTNQLDANGNPTVYKFPKLIQL